MEFTGERFIPGEGDPLIYYEHAHRYLLAAQFAEGKHVLDAACGEGYGSEWLARSARMVTGIDNSFEAVEHASRKYCERNNVRFIQTDVQEIPLRTGSVDLVVSFETIEHLADADVFLEEINRVLAPEGVVVISTPNKKTYSDDSGYDNPYHTTEFYLDDFERKLVDRFGHCTLIGQRVVGASAMWPLSRTRGGPGSIFGDPEGNIPTEIGLDEVVEPLYAVAICARTEMAIDIATLLPSFFVEHTEALIKDYLDRPDSGLVPSLEKDIQVLRDELAVHTEHLSAARDELDARTRELADQSAQAAHAGKRIAELMTELDLTTAKATVAAAELEAIKSTITFRAHRIAHRARIAVFPEASRRGEMWQRLTRRLMSRSGPDRDTSGSP